MHNIESKAKGAQQRAILDFEPQSPNEEPSNPATHLTNDERQYERRGAGHFCRAVSVSSVCALFESVVLVVDSTGAPTQEPDARQHNEKEKKTASFFTLGSFGLQTRREKAWFRMEGRLTRLHICGRGMPIANGGKKLPRL